MCQNELFTKVSGEASGQRLDSFLAGQWGLSRAVVQRAIEQGLVTIDSMVCTKAACRLREGCEIRMTPPRSEELAAIPQDIELDVIHEDSHLAIVNKAPGMVVHPARGHPDGTMVNALVHRWGLRPEDGDLRPGIVHRLDKGTSGLMVVARNPGSKDALTSMFQRRLITKHYLAICIGRPPGHMGTCQWPVQRHPTNRKLFSCSEESGKEARTDWQLIHEDKGLSLMLLHLLTGRTHQIRVHLTAMGLPIIGDPDYGAQAWRGLSKKSLKDCAQGAGRPMLHSFSLAFIHPFTQSPLGFTALPPWDMDDLGKAVFGPGVWLELMSEISVKMFGVQTH